MNLKEKELEKEGKFDELDKIVQDKSKVKIMINYTKTNDSDLQRHELDLFELKECERESNKYL